MTARRLAAVPLLLIAAACASVAPADEELVADLERCSDPADQARYEAAERAVSQGQAAAALDDLEALVRRNPACVRLAITTRRAITLTTAKQQPDLLESMRGIYAAALETAEPDQTGGIAFGVALFARTDAERAKWVSRALRANPRNYYALCLHGEALYRRGDLEDARAALTKAVHLRKSLAEGWLLLARVAEERGLYRTADKHYRSYLGLRPLDRRVQLHYARLLVHNLRDGDRAEPIVDALYEADPTDLDVSLNRGLVYWLQHKWDRAEATYKELLRKHPREPRIALNLGNLYFGAMDAPVRALQAYRYLLSLPSSKDPQTMMNQALFVPSRIKQIKARLTKAKIPIPAPPESADDLE